MGDWLVILGWVATPICALIIGMLWERGKNASKAKGEKELSEAAIKKSIKYIMKRSLQDDYRYYHELGYCPLDDKVNIQEEYELYHKGLDGNGAGTKYFESIMKLPDEPQDN